MMERFFTFFQTYRSGILFFLVCLGSLAFLVQWFAWIFGLGRFGSGAAETGTGAGTGSGADKTNLRKLFSGAFVKIVNDFRHLLALVIIGVFAFALGFSLWKAASLPAAPADSASVINNMKEALQAVVATLGGLVGSIIGYYFGESTAVKTSDTGPATTDIGGPAVQQPSPIRAAPPPPGPSPAAGSVESDE